MQSSPSLLSRTINLYSKPPQSFQALSFFGEVLESFDKEMQLGFENENSWTGKGNAFEALKEYEEAIEAYDTTLEFNCRYGEAWSRKAKVLGELGRFEEAEKCIERCSDLEGLNI